MSGAVRHIVIDMQRLFAEETVWHTPAMAEIIDNVEMLARHFAGRTYFAKFMVPHTHDHAEGRWQIYYQRWAAVTTAKLDPSFQDLMAPLDILSSPETAVEKTTYSVFGAPGFLDRLRTEGVETLVFSGVETDVCVLASLFDAVDAGFQVIVAKDAVTSSDLRSHAAVLDLVLPRLEDQVELMKTETIISLFDETASG